MPSRLKQIVLIFICSTLIVLPAGCTNRFFTPGRELIPNPDVQKHSPEDIYFKSPDGLNLHGWYFRAKEDRGTILVCHGNVENMSTHVTLDLWLIDAGYNVFIFDYRGYGRSEGTPDVRGIHLDAEAALQTLLVTLRREKRERIIVFGKSLGGAISVYVVSHSLYKDRVKALLLDSTFSSYRMIAREKVSENAIGWFFQYPLSRLVNDDYSPVKFIKNVSPVPVIVIQGNNDEIVSEHHGRILYDAAAAPKEFWEVAVPGHVRAQADTATREKLLSFLAALP
jgi:fermentation-respiration switch protein FrsA (DUF1100 family)